MLFDEPIDFVDAIQSQQVKRLLATTLTTKEIAKIPAAIRERARFSAQVMNGRFLEGIDGVIRKVIQPEVVTREAGARVVEGMSEAQARTELKDLLTSLDYKPAEGKEGTIQDLLSDHRLNLIVEMNTDFARGFGQWKSGQTEAVLDQFPAQELYRREERKEPRDWPARWAEAGGEFYPGDSDYNEGRMIAAKDDPIWTEISEFGVPYPPFDWGSGMDLMDVDRDECIELGVKDSDGNEFTDDTAVEPQDRGFDDDMQTGLREMEPALQSALLKSLGSDFLIDSEGILRLVSELAQERRFFLPHRNGSIPTLVIRSNYRPVRPTDG